MPDAEALYVFAGPSLSWPLTAEQLATLATRPGLTAWAAVHDDSPRIWGHFDLTVDGESARLGRVIIDPAQRGRGLAKTLVEFAVRQARELGASELDLRVVIGNLPAITSYRRAGFRDNPNAEPSEFQSMILAL